LCFLSTLTEETDDVQEKQNLQVHKQQTRRKEKQEQEYIGEPPG
jgi:hypothetical protein